MQLPTLHDSPLNEITTMLPSLNEESSKIYPVRSIVNPITSTMTQRKKKKTAQLKTLLHKQKSQLLVKQFVLKMKRLIPSSRVPQYIPLQSSDSSSIFDRIDAKLMSTPGLKMSIFWNVILSLLTLLQSLCSVFVISAYLVFPEMHHELQVSIATYSCIAVGIFDMMLMCVLERFGSTVDMKNLKQIINYNFRQDFKVDALAVLALIIAPFCQSMPISFVLAAISLKKLLKQLARTEKLQNFYLTNIMYQKYYTIIKVTFFNFIIGHAIATLLLLMCNLYPQQNWIIKNGLSEQVWYIKYIWGYYWGVNIMLTVGFGDITATTYHEAFMLIFIQTVSCIMLAYNINTVGSILADIKAKDSTRKKQLRVFYKISQQNRLANQLKKQIMNSINQSFEIKEKFLYDDYDQILQSLPMDVRPVYKRQSNKFLLDNLPFVNILSKKSIMTLSEKIVRKISHPEQIIIKKGDICEFTIFYRGHLQYLCSLKGTKIDGVVAKQSVIKENQQSKLMNLKFFQLDTYKYDIKSKGYSVLYFINQQQLIECLREMKRDFQIYCEYKDKDSLFLASNQIHLCDHCSGQKHDIFNCPKTRYMPLKEFVLIKQFNKMKKKQRRSLIRRQQLKMSCLKRIADIQANHNAFSQCHSYQKLDAPQKKLVAPVFLNILQATIKKSNKIIKASDTNKSLNLSKTFGNECSIANELTTNQIQKIKQALNLSLNEPGEKESYRGFWSLEADQCYDFAYYMKNQNPKYLGKNA